METNNRNEIRKKKEHQNFALCSFVLGIILILISFFFIPLMKEETRRFGEDVVIYDYFAMTFFYVFLIAGILLVAFGIAYFIFNFISKKKLSK